METDSAAERNHRADQQRTRRLASRSCGHCGKPAQEMKPWGKQWVPICNQCQLKLETPATPTPFCAFDEVHPRELRPQTTLEAVVVEAKLLPVTELVMEKKRPSLIGRVLRAIAGISLRGHGKKATRAITGEAD